MRLIFGLLLLAGLGLAGFAINQIQGSSASTQARIAELEAQIVPTTEVLIVSRPFAYGDIMRTGDVETILWPADHVPDGVFQNMSDLFPEGEEPARVVLRTMERNEPVLAVKVAKPGKDGTIETALTPGMRAFTLQVDVNSGMFLRPGSRVDVYWTGTSEVDGGITRLIHPNLPLIAVDQVTDEERNSSTIARTVTVEVRPDVVAKLVQAQATGRLALALVGVAELDAPVTATEELEIQADTSVFLREREEVVQERICTRRIRRGAQVVEEQVDCASLNNSDG
ncbi:MAG: Flp pilus assembly protein CpaB [Pseudomonadota bacterium]